MHLFVIFSILLFWIVTIFIVKNFNLEKEGIIFLLSYSIAIYMIVNLKELLKTIKHKKSIYIFYKNNYNPHYFNHFNNELLLFKKHLAKKLKQYLLNKPIVDNNSIFLNRYFFALELSIQKQHYFYSLNPLSFTSKEYQTFNLNLTMNDIKNLLRNTLTEKEREIIKGTNLLTYRKPGDQPLDVSDVTNIFHGLCKLIPNFHKALKQYYKFYFQESDIKIKLLLSVSENLRFNNIFNLIFLLDGEHFGDNCFLELSKEHNFFNISEKNICFLTLFHNTQSKELSYQYVPLNFLEILKDKFKSNLFIEELSSLIIRNKELYCQPTFIYELEKFVDFMNSLKLVNELNEKLSLNIQKNQKIIKI